MTHHKSLSEQVTEIIKSKSSRSSKALDLKRLGITNYEIKILLQANNNIGGVAKNKQVITFGVEIETYGINRGILLDCARANNLPVEYQGYNHIDSRTVYKFVSDASIQGENPIECVTPVLNNSRNGLRALENCCKTLNQAGAKVNISTGLHVHIGCETLTEQQYINVFHNYKMLENVIDSFMSKSRRQNNSQWCRTLQDHQFNYCTTICDVRSQLGYNRYHKVNAESYDRHRTIEFRQHQGSTDYNKISNWVKFCAALVVWSKDNRLDKQVRSIDNIVFINKTQKRYFKNRAEQLA